MQHESQIYWRPQSGKGVFDALLLTYAAVSSEHDSS